jgi:selenide, water dikinase
MTVIVDAADPIRMTAYGRGGGCACKIPPGELEAIVAGLAGSPDAPAAPLLVGLDNGDDAAVVRLDASTGVVSTVDFFTPVVDDPYDWGRIAAANALSDVYAMGGTPLVALNLLCWPRDTLPMELAREVLRGGHDVARSVGCHVAGGHSIDDGDPKYGMAVTGVVQPDQIISLDAGHPGLPLSLTKPLGVGVLNTMHKTTGTAIPQAIAVMTATNREASAAAVRAGVRCGTDVTGFGLLGHAYKLARASGVTVAIDAARVPYVDGARAAAEAGHVSGGTRRNLAWVAPMADFGAAGETERLLLADAQTSGGLLVAGEVPGGTVIGELLPAGEHALVIR